MKPNCVSCSYSIPSQPTNPQISVCIKKHGLHEFLTSRKCEHFSMIHPFLIKSRLKKYPQQTQQSKGI